MEDLYLVHNWQLQISSKSSPLFWADFHMTQTQDDTLADFFFKVGIILRWNIYYLFKICQCLWYSAR